MITPVRVSWNCFIKYVTNMIVIVTNMIKYVTNMIQIVKNILSGRAEQSFVKLWHFPFFSRPGSLCLTWHMRICVLPGSLCDWLSYLAHVRVCDLPGTWELRRLSWWTLSSLPCLQNSHLPAGGTKNDDIWRTWRKLNIYLLTGQHKMMIFEESGR